jgi:hypothetical protein
LQPCASAVRPGVAIHIAREDHGRHVVVQAFVRHAADRFERRSMQIAQRLEALIFVSVRPRTSLT